MEDFSVQHGTHIAGKERQVTLPRSMELQWQKEIIERWLNSPGVPANAQGALREELEELKKEIEDQIAAGPALSQKWQA